MRVSIAVSSSIPHLSGFIEGMADYFAEDNDAIGEMVIRDASMNNNIVPLPQLHNFNRLSSPFVGYKLGQLAVAYLTETYGREKIAEILQGLRQSRTKGYQPGFHGGARGRTRRI